jgi:hypothetical protein
MPIDLPDGFTLEEPIQPEMERMPASGFGATDLPSGFEIEEPVQPELSGAQTALGYAEAASRGLFSPAIATGLELAAANVPTMVGLPPLTTPENIRMREEALGAGATAAEAAGFFLPAALSLGTTGFAKAGIIGTEAALNAAKVASISQAGLLSKIGEKATEKIAGPITKRMIQYGLEAGIMSGLDEAGKAMIAKDPDAPSKVMGGALMNMGASAAFGAVLGAGVGFVSPLWESKYAAKTMNELQKIDDGAVRPAVDFVEELEKVVPNAEEKGLLKEFTKLKPNAEEIKAAGEEIGAVVPEGMVLKSEKAQHLDSSVTKSPSVIGWLRSGEYQRGFDAVDKNLRQIMETSVPDNLTAADVGEAVAGSLESKTVEFKDLHDELYAAIRQDSQFVPVKKKAIDAVARNLEALQKNTPDSPAALMLKRISNNLRRIEDVEGVRDIVATINQYVGENPTLRSFGAEAKDRLNNLAQKSIKDFAKEMVVPEPEAAAAVQDLLKRIDEANASYAPFRDKLRVLAEGLGLRRIEGPADFMVKLRKLTPEKLFDRVFANKDSRFLRFMAAEFSEELRMVLDLKKKELLSGVDMAGNRLNANQLIKKIDKLSPRMMENMFTPDEVSKLNAVKLWMKNLPKDVNPSNTAAASAFNEFWKNPLAAAAITIGDAGKVAALKTLGSGAPASAKAFKATADYIVNAHAGVIAAEKAAQAIFSGKGMPSLVYDDKKGKRLDEQAKIFQKDPQEFVKKAEAVGHYMPEASLAYSAQAARTFGYLNQKRPEPKKNGMLDNEIKPSREKLGQYSRTLEIAEQPLSVMKKILDGTLTSKDVIDLKSMYPELYQDFQKRIMNKMVDHAAKGKIISSKIKKSLSVFSAHPLDSNLTPMAIQAAQATYQQQGQAPEQQMPQMAPKSSRKSQLPTQTQTDQQRRILKQ